MRPASTRPRMFRDIPRASAPGDPRRSRRTVRVPGQLLVVATVFGFIGAQSIGSRIIRTLHQFPVVGASFNPASHHAVRGS